MKTYKELMNEIKEEVLDENRYNDAAKELEDKIKSLEDRASRWENHPTLHTRVAGVRAEIAALRAKPVAKWRSTGKWSQEIWGTKK